MPRLQQIEEWLDVNVSRPSLQYQHLLAKERNGQRHIIFQKLREMVRAAHADARDRLARLAGPSLDPLAATDPNADIGYPGKLSLTTLKGYFGEFFAAVVAENFDPFDLDDWVVPAFLFRFHTVAFQQLDAVNQAGQGTVEVPGRTGDDCLAFRLDPNSQLIVASLMCEAKCTHDHSSDLVRAAHVKASASNHFPVDLLQLVEVLESSSWADAALWINAIRNLYWQQHAPGYERYDQITYICGRSPVRESTWIPNDTPHGDYAGARSLHVAEIHLTGVDEFVCEIYGKERNDA